MMIIKWPPRKSFTNDTHEKSHEKERIKEIEKIIINIMMSKRDEEVEENEMKEKKIFVGLCVLS